MKKLLLSLFCFANMFAANAQAITGDYLDINNVKAYFNVGGDLFLNFANMQFEVPKGSGTSTIFTGNLWIGGYDAGGALKTAAQTYRLSGTDFFQGPIDTTGTYGTSYDSSWNRVWKINKYDIDSFVIWINGGSIGPNPIDSIAMEVINNWPVFNMIGEPLAPYVDVNIDGIYDPSSGDYPKIKGDQAIFFVYNDSRDSHTATSGAKLGIEIQGMAYAYNCANDSALYNTIFTNYKIINKSPNRLDSVFIGNWTDFDIGYFTDDYVGCDVTRGAYYGYNGDSLDNGGYGLNPPAQAVVFLSGPFADPDGIDNPANSTPNGTAYGDGIIDNERMGMGKFIYFNNTANPVNGNPTNGDDFYQYLTGTWRTGVPVTYGADGTSGSVNCNYMFPENSDPLGYGTNMVPQTPWDETSAGIVPSDRRGLGSYGPFTFIPGATQEVDFAYVYGRANSGGNWASVTVMKNRIDSVRNKFNTIITGYGCSGNTGINNLSNNIIVNIYPNPTNKNITIDYKTLSKKYNIKIYNASGTLIKNIDLVNSFETIINISDFKNGIYLLNVYDGKNFVSKRFIKQ